MSNPLIANFLANPPANPAMPALGTDIAMPGPAPSMGAPALPSVSLTPPPTQTQIDQTEYNRQKNTGSGVDQIQNPLLRGIARAADIAGSVFAPNLAQFIPGTTLHHQLTMNQAARNVATDQAEEQSNAKTQQEQALAQQETAKAAALADPHKAVDPSKTVQSGDDVFQLNPETGRYDIRVGDRPEKPKTIEQQAYDYAVSQGKNPLDAYGAVYGSKNTKDAGLPQQYLDAIASGDTVKAGLIKKVINDTSTQPKIQVINAAAADRAQATTTGLDTSDPAMQASINAVANGSMKLSDVFGRGATTAQKAQFAAAVKQVNPNYNSGDHDIENAVRRDMTSGHDSNTLNAINTAYHHLDNFAAAARTLKGGDVKAMNELANAMGVQVQKGASPQVIADLVKNALKGEVARAFTGAGATVDEQHNLDTSFGNANSLDTMLGVANETKSLLKGKETTLREKFESGTQGKPNFIDDNAGPKEGDTKVNSHGDKVKFSAGKWGPA